MKEHNENKAHDHTNSQRMSQKDENSKDDTEK